MRPLSNHFSCLSPRLDQSGLICHLNSGETSDFSPGRPDLAAASGPPGYSSVLPLVPAPDSSKTIIRIEDEIPFPSELRRNSL